MQMMNDNPEAEDEAEGKTSPKWSLQLKYEKWPCSLVSHSSK